MKGAEAAVSGDAAALFFGTRRLPDRCYIS